MLLLVSAMGMGQTKTILPSNRVFARNDKVSEFDKALANHAQKYHTGDVKWQVLTASLTSQSMLRGGISFTLIKVDPHQFYIEN